MRNSILALIALFINILLSNSLSYAATNATTDAAVSKALESNLKSLQILESLAKKSENTPREKSILVKLIESLIQVDHQSKQKKLAQSSSTQPLDKNLIIQQKLIAHSTRFIAVFPNDPMAARVYSVRAKAKEALGDVSGQQQDLEVVYAKADPKSEERFKAAAKLGEIYRQKGNLAKSENILSETLKSAKAEWSQFILETLLQTQYQGRAYDRAILTLNQLIAKFPKDSSQREGLMTSKGQVLGKLLVLNKVSLDNFFQDISKDSINEQIIVVKTAMLEMTVVNNEQLCIELVQHQSFRAYQSETKILITSELASLFYDQKAHESLLMILTEMQGYAKIQTDVASPQHVKIAALVENSLKKLTELSQKIQNTISKDSKLARQSEGKALELLYAIIGKINVRGDSINAETKYNKASLYLVQDRPEAAYPIFKELGQFKDSEDKFRVSMIRTFKKNKMIPDSWDFQKKTDSKLPATAAKDLEDTNKKYCDSEKFDESLCFDSLKGLVSIGKTEQLETVLKSIIFDSKRKDETKEQSFSALFDYYQASHQPEQASQILNLAQKKGVHLSNALKLDAKKSVRSQILSSVKKNFDEGKNLEVIEQVKKFETENDQLVFAELFAYAGLAAQKLGKDDVAQTFYGKFDEQSTTDPKPDPAFHDLVAVGHALAFEKALDFNKAAYWWTTVRNWNSRQKKIALNTLWLAADYPKLKTMILTPSFCSKEDAVICDEYKKLFVATWPIFAKEFQFKKNQKPNDLLDEMVQLSIQDVQNPARLSWVLDLHTKWSSMEQVRQIALYPNFQKYLKAEVESWTVRETAKFSKVKSLMEFQTAMKNFKAAEVTLKPLMNSPWSDFQVYHDIATALVYESSVSALTRAKTTDQAVLAQDPSLKQLFEETSNQLAAKQKEIMERGLAHAQNFSLDLSLFAGLIAKYPEWEQLSKLPVKTSPEGFYSGLAGNSKTIKNLWQNAFKDYNWAKVGFCVVQLHADKTVPQDVAQIIEAETFLRFGNRIDSQATITTLQSNVKVGPAPASKESP